jgi:hypothetical protein
LRFPDLVLWNRKLASWRVFDKAERFHPHQALDQPSP